MAFIILKALVSYFSADATESDSFYFLTRHGFSNKTAGVEVMKPVLVTHVFLTTVRNAETFTTVGKVLLCERGGFRIAERSVLTCWKPNSLMQYAYPGGGKTIC